MRIRKAIMHYNGAKKDALRTRDGIVKFLKTRGIKVEVRHPDRLSKWGETRIPHFKYSDRFGRTSFSESSDAKLLERYKGIHGKEKADLLITIGGDGTLLFYKGLYNLPIFGVGSRTSFLCQARMDNWKPIFERMLENLEVEEQPMLEAKFGKHSTEPALNEVCVKNPRHRMLRFKLWIGRREYTFGADGVIFSTARGSSAYAYSAGGKEFSQKDMYEVVPVAPHRRSLKPMLVKDNVPAVLKILSRYRHDVVDVVVDGQLIYEMGLNANLRIVRSRKKVRMLR